MAIARCEQCGKQTQNVKPPGYFDKPFLPVGHPSSGVVCGRPDCENNAVVWLKAGEAEAYRRGQRVFDMHTQTVKVRLQ